MIIYRSVAVKGLISFYGLGLFLYRPNLYKPKTRCLDLQLSKGTVHYKELGLLNILKIIA